MNYSCIKVFHSFSHTRIDGPHNKTVVAAIEAEVGDTCAPTTVRCTTVCSIEILYYAHYI